MGSYNYPVFGTVFGRGGAGGPRAFTSGIPLSARQADNTVNREIFTHDATVTGDLEHDVSRNEGLHVSVSHRQVYSSLGPMRTITERKIFADGDWTIYNASGVAVGADLGTTDVDVTPSGVGTN